MKKIMFNDHYGLTEAVLEGKKTMTRRLIKQPPYENYEVAFPTPDVAFDDNSPLAYAFCWVNKDNREEHTEWIRPQWKIGEEVAVSQNYRDILGKEYLSSEQEDKAIKAVNENHKGCTNKMFVRAELMPHRVRITNIKLQQLQDISDEDCLKEGVVKEMHSFAGGMLAKYYPSSFHVEAVEKIGWGIVYDTPQIAFAKLIDFVSGKETWNNNPWVFVYEFELVR